MGVLNGIFTLLKFLPEMVTFLKLLANLTEKGVEKVEIMRAVKKIDEALKDRDPVERSRRLNDIFRG